MIEENSKWYDRILDFEITVTKFMGDLYFTIFEDGSVLIRSEKDILEWYEPL